MISLLHPPWEFFQEEDEVIIDVDANNFSAAAVWQQNKTGVCEF